MKRRTAADDEAAYQRAVRAATIQAQAAWMRRQNLPGAPTAEEARELARHPESTSNRTRRARMKRAAA